MEIMWMKRLFIYVDDEPKMKEKFPEWSEE
jgi:hypothetical protein